MASPRSGTSTCEAELEDSRAALTELTEVHEQLKASAIKLEMAYRGLFGEYVKVGVLAERAAGQVEQCDAAYVAATRRADACEEQLDGCTGWLGLPGWAWALIGAGAGATATAIVVAAVR